MFLSNQTKINQKSFNYKNYLLRFNQFSTKNIKKPIFHLPHKQFFKLFIIWTRFNINTPVSLVKQLNTPLHPLVAHSRKLETPINVKSIFAR